MKKLILLSAAGLLWLGADAQQARQSVVRAVGSEDAKNATIKAAPLGSARHITQSRYRNTAKVTATPFFSETFGSGTNTALPTGWTTTAGTGLSASWKWMNRASTSPFTNGVINSTTANDGWMIYDSDSIGDVHPTVLPLTGSLISPTINCSSHSSVLVSFQSYFRRFTDSVFMDVSINGGSSWTTFGIVEHNALPVNATSKNPVNVRMNITSLAANQANVKLRFRYIISTNSGAGGAYSWQIDDLAVSEIDPVELSLDNSAMYLYGGGSMDLYNYMLFSNYPKTLIDSLVPVVYVTNNGLNSVSSVPLEYKLFLGTTQIHTSTGTLPLIPTNGADSTQDMPGFRPTQVGAYTAAFRVNAPGDGFTGNDVDTQRFNITDTLLTTYGNTQAGGYYLHRPNTHSAGEGHFQWGVRFDVPAGKKDTLTSVAVSYDDNTTLGVNTVVQIYRMTGDATSGFNWTPVGTTRQKTLTAADRSTTTTLVYSNYLINTAASGGSIAPFILEAGHYAAIVKTIGATPSADVVINTAIPIVDKYNIAGYYGQRDTSENSNNYTFSPVGIATGTAGLVPLMRVHFGTWTPTTSNPGSVATINGVEVGAAYPNPANNTLNVPVTAGKGASVNVSISNMVGQVLMTQTISNIGAGQTKSAVFNTSSLAPGIYVYTVESNGERVSNRVVIAH